MSTRRLAARYITKGSLCLLNLPLLLLALWVPASATSQQAGCDPTLRARADHPHGYRMRGDRCEGIYIQDVALATLLVASLTESYESFDPRRGGELHLAWSVPWPAAVQLRAYSLTRKLYYRMDTLQPAGRTTYLWPSGLLAALDITRPNLGVVAWMQHRFGDEYRPIYLPLQIRQAEEPAGAGGLPVNRAS
jgi:hypothetical protein